MKIAVNTRFLLPDKLEGLGWYTHEIMRRMVLQHPEDQFVFIFDRPFDPQFLYAPNVETRVVFPPARHPLLWYLWFEWALPRVLLRVQPDVFFSPDAYLSLSSSVPTVMTVHDLAPLHAPEQIPWGPRTYYRHFVPRFIRRAERLITISEYTRRDVIDTCSISPEKIAVAYNGCRENFKPLNEEARRQVQARYAGGAPYFFYSGAIHPRKNIPRLIRAFERMKTQTNAPVRLLLAGRMAWQTGEVSSAWHTSPYKDDIRFLGYVPDEELALLTGAALALTYMSLAEGFGLPLIEAMHAETPVICSNTTALPEVAGAAALLVDPLDSESIARALEAVWRDEVLRARLIDAGRQQRRRFSWDRAAETIYQQLISVAR